MTGKLFLFPVFFFSCCGEGDDFLFIRFVHVPHSVYICWPTLVCWKLLFLCAKRCFGFHVPRVVLIKKKKATKYAIGGRKPNNCRRQQEQLSAVQITFIAEQMTLISAQGFSGVWEQHFPKYSFQLVTENLPLYVTDKFFFYKFLCWLNTSVAYK